MASKKKPKQDQEPKPNKSVRSTEIGFQEKMVRSGQLKFVKTQPISLPIVSRMNVPMMWSRKRRDIVGKWTWGQSRNWSKEIWDEKIFPTLRGYKGKVWKEIDSETAGGDKRNKAYKIQNICTEAQNRLFDLELDDMDEIYRFRTGNLQRIYGFRIAEWFFLLWWDEHHKICPSKK